MDVDQEDFDELTNKERLESRAEWERAVFKPFQTDEQMIFQYFFTLFGSKEPSRALAQLKKTVNAFENELAAPDQFNTSVLHWTINGLLSSDLLADDKRAVLKDFQANPTILAEVADVFNMRMAALDTWSWGDSVPIEQRKKLNGTYGVYMHEDLLQAVFLQHIGVKWSVFLKGAFQTYAASTAWLPSRIEIPAIDKKRREYLVLNPKYQTYSPGTRSFIASGSS